MCAQSPWQSIKDPEIIQKMRVHAPGSVRSLIFGQNICELSRSKMGFSSLSEQRYQNLHFTQTVLLFLKPPLNTNRRESAAKLVL